MKRQIDPKLKELLEGFSLSLGKLIDETLDKAELQQMDMCVAFDSMSHLISQRIGQLDMIHIESDMLDKDPNAKIDREMLEKLIDNIQLNAVYSISLGMNDVLKAGGHYTIDELKTHLIHQIGGRSDWTLEKIESEEVDQISDEDNPKKGKKTFH